MESYFYWDSFWSDGNVSEPDRGVGSTFELTKYH